MPMRIALLGAGWAARAVYGPALADYRKRRGGLTLAAVCDLDAARAAEVRADFGFECAYTSLAELFRHARLDAAIAAVSVPHNAAVAQACLRAGLPTLVEKPPALTARAARDLVRAVRRSRGRLMVAFNRRWAPALVRLKALALEAGPIHGLRGDMCRIKRRDPDFSTTAIHTIDTLRFLTGADYAHLAIEYGRCGPEGQAATYHALGAMTTGAAVAFDVVPMAGLDLERYTVHAGGRTFVAEIGFGKSPDTLVEWSAGRPRNVAFKSPSSARHDAGGFYQELAAFLDAVKKGGPLPRPSAADAVQSVTVMEALARRRARYHFRKDSSHGRQVQAAPQ